MAIPHREHAPSLPVTVQSREATAIPRTHSPTPAAAMPPPPLLTALNPPRSVSPLPALHSIPPPLVTQPSPTSPSRVSTSPRTGAAASEGLEEEEEWNKKFSEEERQAELMSSATEQKVIESLRGTLHRLMRPRTQSQLESLPWLIAYGEEARVVADTKMAVDTKPMIKETFGFRLELGRASALDDVSLNLYDYTVRFA